MRVVVDTNVLLSGLLGGRGTEPVIRYLIQKKFRLITSEILIQELAFVLHRPYWKELISSADRHEFLMLVREAAQIVRPVRRISVCRDPKDNAVLECAVAGRADRIVTGDKDLLVLKHHEGIPIVRPAEFLEYLPGPGSGM